MADGPAPPSPRMEIPLAGDDAAAAAAWDWDSLLDFATLDGDDPLILPWEASPPLDPAAASPPPLPPPAPASPPRVRKRDPRLVCENYLAGRVPCACPEMDALEQELEEEEEVLEGVVAGGRKRAKAGERAVARCQVPGCEADIRELKGYHRRHRVCLRCANAASVLVDGEEKRYCQQCGKFHILLDFDEGKRSCRRKLERHNKRRRRRPTDATHAGEKEKEAQRDSSADISFDGELTKDASNVILCERPEIIESNQKMEAEKLLESEDGQGSPPIYSCVSLHNVQSNSIASFTDSGGDQIAERTDITKSALSSSFCDNKSVYSSACPTGRISFKLYDWNPAEFPRRLRHQIFQWLANMPVELEGYIRPGCTILTVFVAMPQFMWEKLSQDVALYVTDLINAPDSLFVGRSNFLVYLSNTIIQVLKDGTSLMNIAMEVKAPRLHYVYPTYFEAGKPMNFVACGSHLDQPKFRFLVSFAGKYLVHDSCRAMSEGNIKSYDRSEGNCFHSSEHEMFKISIKWTDPETYGPAFIEVENSSGLSNFVPVLFGNKHICSELERMHTGINESFSATSIMSQIAVTGFSPDICKLLASKRDTMSELLLDIAWLLRDPQINKNEVALNSTRILRLTSLLKFAMQNKLVSVLEVIQRYVDKLSTSVGLDKSANRASNADFALLLNYLRYTRENHCFRTSLDLQPELNSRDSVRRHLMSHDDSKDEIIWTLPCSNQDMEGRSKDCLVLTRTSASQENDVDIPLITKENIHKQRIYPHVDIKWCGKGWSSNLPLKATGQHVAVFLMVSAVLCCGACVALYHPHGAREFAVSIRRCLFGGPLT